MKLFNFKILTAIFLVILITYLALGKSNNSGNIIVYSSNKGIDQLNDEESNYLLWINKNDPLSDKFIQNINAIAGNNGVKKIVALELDLFRQKSTLFYYDKGDLMRRVRSDQSLKELEAFFKKDIYIPKDAKYGNFNEKGYTFLIKDMVISHLITNQSDITDIDKDQYLISFKIYVYNNEKKIKEDIQKDIENSIQKYLIIKSDNGSQIRPSYLHTSLNTSTLYIGDRAKSIVTYVLPTNDINNLILHLKYEYNKRNIKLSTLEKFDTINDKILDF
ncbi:MAG: hypothetical protein H0Z32_15900 [Bacillaceae bacterium]|nr:hypothetical protein [Bacillaceae bacterium]